MSKVNLLARNCTLFTTSKALDEDAYRESLQRFVDFKIGPFLASGGSGEANSLSRDEVRRIYQIGVEVCRGKVPVYANMPEVRSAREAIDFSRLAIEAGVDIVNLYGPASLHGYRPTDGELTAYFDEVLTAIKHPVTLAPNPIQGYSIKPQLIAEFCNRYPQVESVTLNGLDGDTYFIDLKDALKRDVGMNVPLAGSLHTLGLGATGLSCNQTNFIPGTVRRYVDCYERGDLAAAHHIYADLHRFNRFVEQWRGARWQKMALKVFRLPGGEGGTAQAVSDAVRCRSEALHNRPAGAGPRRD
jgi:4-hydroxy-tetrahydrodipicolinate synthase